MKGYSVSNTECQRGSSSLGATTASSAGLWLRIELGTLCQAVAFAPLTDNQAEADPPLRIGIDSNCGCCAWSDNNNILPNLPESSSCELWIIISYLHSIIPAEMD
jgi:hypothetical protein